jgi:23S rRNA pseudouridine1911/1915/1917 synthase
MWKTALPAKGYRKVRHNVDSGRRRSLKIELSPEDSGKRLDHALHQRLPQFSRARLQGWIKDGHVLINGAVRRTSYLVRKGDVAEVEAAEPAPLRATAEEIPLTVLYEDEDLVAIDKPAGMVVHSGAGVHSGTLVNALLHRFRTLSRAAGELRPGIVHRLDRYTSGVLLVAKNDAAHQRLAEQFVSRRVEKTYLALVHGKVKLERGRIEKPIARDPRQRVRMTARLARGREAWTEYHVLRRFRDFTFLEVRIGTGRTHQIRVHLSSIGHPVVGDRLYGAPAKIEGEPTLSRYFLHSHRIRFEQPSTGERITVESPLPAELAEWMKGIL